MLKPILQLKAVSKSFTVGERRIQVLSDLDLTLHAGSMVAIVGASGSGKSTLLNILGCLDRPTSGSYRVAGRNIEGLDSDQLARLRRRYFGFVFQRYHLLPAMSALDNVVMPAIYAHMPAADRQARATELLDRLGLADWSGHRPHQLSGGQQQRISIARALINGGEVILADEPTGALDSETGREVMGILLELQAQGHTVILVTHDMEVASHAERIIELRDGKIVSDRPNAQRALARPQTAAVAPRRRRLWPRASAFRRVVETFVMARRAITSHRLRNALTILGIVIGIASVVSIMGVGAGAERHMRETIGSMASSLIEIHRGRGWGDSHAAAVHTLLPGDIDALREQRFVADATPLTRQRLTVRHRDAAAQALVSGVGEGFFFVRNVGIESGRAIGEDDVREQYQVVVIDQETRRRLFLPTEDPIGKVIIVGKIPCTVIGVTAEASQEALRTEGLNILIPYSTAGVRLFGQQHFDSIIVRLADAQDSGLAEQGITSLLQFKHGARDFFLNNMDALARAYDQTTRSISLTLSLIGAIALIVGGIGVMNMMLVSVTERTREIGIRMAVGARRSDIRKQFLSEAVVICLIGGVLGVLVAFAASHLFTAFVREWRMVLTGSALAAAFLCSTLVGVVFGFLPARKASLLSPNEALSRD